MIREKEGHINRATFLLQLSSHQNEQKSVKDLLSPTTQRSRAKSLIRHRFSLNFYRNEKVSTNESLREFLKSKVKDIMS